MWGPATPLGHTCSCEIGLQPVLFGTALNNIVQEFGAENASFLEIVPHPVLKSYIEEIGGKPISPASQPQGSRAEHWRTLPVPRGYRQLIDDRDRIQT